MHTNIIANPDTPSMEAPSCARPEPSYLTVFPAQPMEEVMACCPELVRNIVDDICRAANGSPEAVTATALAVIASALGPNIQVQTPGEGSVPVMFNVGVFHQAPRMLPWFDLLANPFTRLIYNKQSALAANGMEMSRRIVAQWEEDLKKARHSPGFNEELETHLQEHTAMARAGLKPFVVTGCPVLQNLARHVPNAFDGGVTVISFCNDPGAELLRLKSAERARIAEVLNQSWAGAPLTFGRNTYSGTVSFLWQTTRKPHELMGSIGFDPGLVAVPVLMIREEQVPAFRSLSGVPHQGEWSRTIEIIFKRRCAAAQTVFTVPEESEAVLNRFAMDIEEHLDQVPIEAHPHVVWLPDLARRLALLFSLLTTEMQTSVDMLSAQNAVAITAWLARQHLCAVMENPRKIDTTARVDRTDKAAVMLAKITTKGPISRRVLWRSFDKPTADWFDTALEGLIASGRVLKNEQKKLVACP